MYTTVLGFNDIIETISNDFKINLKEIEQPKSSFIGVLTVDKKTVVNLSSTNYKDAKQELSVKIIEIGDSVKSAKLIRVDKSESLDVKKIIETATEIKQKEVERKELEKEYQEYKRLKNKFGNI